MSETFYLSPVGWLKLSANETGLTGVDLLAAKPKQKPVDGENPHLNLAVRQLEEYFAGTRREFTVSLSDKQRVSPFLRKVWSRLRKIPFGKTMAYSEIAARLGSPNSSRAVGNACGRNPFLIIVPCHRVVRSDGSLGGFALDLRIKQRLLNHERETLHPCSN